MEVIAVILSFVAKRFQLSQIAAGVIGTGSILVISGCSNSYSIVPPSSPTPPGVSASAPDIATENSFAGTKAWQITQRNNSDPEGYPSMTSVAQGGSIDLMINTASPTATLQVFRLGWYQGLGGRAVTIPTTVNTGPQASPLTDPATGLTECNWKSAYTITVPTNWTSGAYLVKVTATSTGNQGYIPFVVTDSASHSDLLYQLSTFTYQAYNAWGGKSLYGYNSSNGMGAVKVSFHRPYEQMAGSGYLMDDLATIRYLEKHGYDVAYSTDYDVHKGAVSLTQHKALIVGGHDEYWSKDMRDRVTNARDAGVHLGMLSANEMYWQVRVEPSSLTGTADTTLVCYRTDADPYEADPSKIATTTVKWRESPLKLPEQLVLGSQYVGLMSQKFDMVVADPTSWVFGNTGLAKGDHLVDLIQNEANAYFPSIGPSSVSVLAHSPFTTSNGKSTYSDMTVYTASSGAIVFDASTTYWKNGLEPVNPSQFPPATINAVQQITANVLAKFGAIPKS